MMCCICDLCMFNKYIVRIHIFDCTEAHGMAFLFIFAWMKILTECDACPWLYALVL